MAPFEDGEFETKFSTILKRLSSCSNNFFRMDWVPLADDGDEGSINDNAFNKCRSPFILAMHRLGLSSAILSSLNFLDDPKLCKEVGVLERGEVTVDDPV